MKLVLIIVLIVPQLCFAQFTKQDSVWLPFNHFIGRWSGTGEGPDGKGTYERSYQFVLEKKFIEVRNKSTYPATKEKPKGYSHEDYGMISYDKSRKTFFLRQFHSEGFVNEYILESISADGKKIVFTTESIENIPRGWRARETYTISVDSLAELFELAEPGKGFEPYTKAAFRRSK